MDQVFDIVIDVQYDFMQPDGKLYVPDAEAIIPALRDFLADMNSAGVLFTYDTHLKGVYETSEEAKEFPIHCIKDTPGWQLVVDPATVTVPVYFMEKGVFDMWKEDGLTINGASHSRPGRRVGDDRDTFFENLKAADITKLRIVGVAADYCVKWAIDGAVSRGFEIEVIRALTVGIQRDIDQVLKDDFADQPAVTVT